jgi:hypothetical protein
VVGCLLKLVKEKKAIGEVFNIGNGEEVSILRLAELVKAQTNSTSEIVFVPYDKAYEAGFEDMPRRVPDLTKIHNLVGYVPKVQLNEIIGKVIEYFRHFEVGRSVILVVQFPPMKRVIFGLLALTLVTGWASPGWAAGLTLTIHDGRVSLDAQDVSLRQILTEWARVGKTRIVNLERVSSAPVTLKFDSLPEDQALDIILRSVPGYFAAPRPVPAADASIYDRIALMTTTTQVAAQPASASRPQGQPFYQDPSQNVTQLRPMPAPLSPGQLPDAADNQRDASDPAIAAAIAAGLIPPPGPTPGTVSPPLGQLQAPLRGGAAPPPTPAQPQAATPANPWGAPVGTSMPGLPTPVPASTTPPPTRPVGAVRPQQADQ